MSKANQLKIKYSNHKSNRTSVSQLHSLKIWPNKNKRPNVIQSTRKHTYAEVEKSTCNQGTVTICTKSWNSFSNIRFWMSLDHARWSPLHLVTCKAIRSMENLRLYASAEDSESTFHQIQKLIYLIWPLASAEHMEQ